MNGHFQTGTREGYAAESQADTRVRASRRVQGARALVLLTTLSLLLAACSDSVLERSLDRLVDNQSGYDGREVITQGTVRHFEEPLHYWIEDADLNRVALEPAERVADHAGAQVRVEGTFAVSREGGRLIRVDRISRVDP